MCFFSMCGVLSTFSVNIRFWHIPFQTGSFCFTISTFFSFFYFSQFERVSFSFPQDINVLPFSPCSFFLLYRLVVATVFRNRFRQKINGKTQVTEFHLFLFIYFYDMWTLKRMNCHRLLGKFARIALYGLVWWKTEIGNQIKQIYTNKALKKNI